jgi:uncharacterized protein with HEPN domain
MKDNKVYLNEILQFIKNVRKFTKGISLEKFKTDHKTATACLLEVMMIGEVSKKLNFDIKDKIDLPWLDIQGFRNKSIHEYNKIEFATLSDIVYKELKVVDEKIKQYLKDSK